MKERLSTGEKERRESHGCWNSHDRKVSRMSCERKAMVTPKITTRHNVTADVTLPDKDDPQRGDSPRSVTFYLTVSN